MTRLTAGDLRDDTEVYKIRASGRVHLKPGCANMADSGRAPSAKEAGVLWDDEEICKRCIPRARDLRPGLPVHVPGGGDGDRVHLDPDCDRAGGELGRAEAGDLPGDRKVCPRCAEAQWGRNKPEPGAVPDQTFRLLEDMAPEDAGLRARR